MFLFFETALVSVPTHGRQLRFLDLRRVQTNGVAHSETGDAHEYAGNTDDPKDRAPTYVSHQHGGEDRCDQTAEIGCCGVKCQGAAARFAKVGSQRRRAHRMLRAGADAAEHPREHNKGVAGGEAGGDHRDAKQNVADAQDHAAAHVRHDESIKGLEKITDKTVNRGNRTDGDKADAEIAHHQRIKHTQHRRLKMI